MSNKIRVVSLFSGIGGFEKGLDISNLDYKVVFASEINEFARNTYSCNFDDKCLFGDITKINEKNIPDHDLLCAGFPCQSFSVAGKRRGFNDIRGTLFFDVIRVIKEKKPKIILLENVKNLISHDNGKTIKIILESISNCNYTFDFTVINSKEAGVPQNRERTYIVGKYNGNTQKFVDDKRNTKVNNLKLWCNENNLKTMNFFNGVVFKGKKKSIIDILEDSVDSKYFIDNNKTKRLLKNFELSENYSKRENRIIKIFELPKEVHNDLERQRRVYSVNGILPTLLARSDSPKIYIEEINKIRKLTPLECFKGQGFDNMFVKNIKYKSFSDTQLYKQAGNAVSPPVIKGILNRVMESIYE